MVLFPAPQNCHTIGLEFFKRLLLTEKAIHSVILASPPGSAEEYHQVLRSSPKVIGISAALPEQLDYVSDLLRWQKQFEEIVAMPTIMIGGAAANAFQHASGATGGDSIYISDSNNVKATLDEVERICSRPGNAAGQLTA